MTRNMTMKFNRKVYVIPKEKYENLVEANRKKSSDEPGRLAATAVAGQSPSLRQSEEAVVFSASSNKGGRLTGNGGGAASNGNTAVIGAPSTQSSTLSVDGGRARPDADVDVDTGAYADSRSVNDADSDTEKSNDNTPRDRQRNYVGNDNRMGDVDAKVNDEYESILRKVNAELVYKTHEDKARTILYLLTTSPSIQTGGEEEEEEEEEGEGEGECYRHFGYCCI